MVSRNSGLYDSNVAVAFLWPLKWLFGALLLYVMLGLIALTAAFLFAKYLWLDPVQAADALFQSETARVKELVRPGSHAAGLSTLTEHTQ